MANQDQPKNFCPAEIKPGNITRAVAARRRAEVDRVQCASDIRFISPLGEDDQLVRRSEHHFVQAPADSASR